MIFPNEVSCLNINILVTYKLRIFQWTKKVRILDIVVSNYCATTDQTRINQSVKLCTVQSEFDYFHHSKRSKMNFRWANSWGGLKSTSKAQPPKETRSPLLEIRVSYLIQFILCVIWVHANNKHTFIVSEREAGSTSALARCLTKCRKHRCRRHGLKAVARVALLRRVLTRARTSVPIYYSESAFPCVYFEQAHTQGARREWSRRGWPRCYRRYNAEPQRLDRRAQVKKPEAPT